MNEVKKHLKDRIKEFNLYLRNAKKSIKICNLVDTYEIQERTDEIKCFIWKIEELKYILKELENRDENRKSKNKKIFKL